MKIVLKKSNVTAKRLLGNLSNLNIHLELLDRVSQLYKFIIESQSLAVVGEKIYLEIVSSVEFYGPFVEVVGVIQNPGEIKAIDFRDLTVYSMDYGELEADWDQEIVQNPKLFLIIDSIKSKYTVKNVFLTLELDKIELHFFE
jgi:hypothetical protein